MEIEDWSTDELIDRFCQAIARGFAGRSREPGIDLWPQPVFSPFEGDYFVQRALISKLHRILRKLSKDEIPIDKVSKLFLRPSRTAILTYLFAHDSLNREEVTIRTEVAKILLRVLAVQRNGDPFCESGKNLCWDPEALKTSLSGVLLERVGAISKKEVVRRSIAELIVALRGYCELVYFAGLSTASEVHGPYKIEHGNLLVREYYDMKPSFWEFTTYLPFSSVTVYTIYPASIEVSFDYSGRLITTDSLGPALEYVYLEVDAKAVAIKTDRLADIVNSVSRASTKAILEIQPLERNELMDKWIESRFWSLKPVAESVGEDWYPPKEVHNRVRLEPPDTLIADVLRGIQGLDAEARIRVMAELFDPRILNKKRRLLPLWEGERNSDG